MYLYEVVLELLGHISMHEFGRVEEGGEGDHHVFHHGVHLFLSRSVDAKNKTARTNARVYGCVRVFLS